MKARCPHGSPWYVECWPCADEVIAEHRRKVIPLRRPYDFSIYLDEYQYPTFGVRGCGYTGFDRAFDGVPFFSAEHPSPGGTVFQFVEPEPLTQSRWNTLRKDMLERIGVRHLRVVK